MNCFMYFIKREAEKMIFKKMKRGIISEYLPWILIAVAVLVILMITIFILRGRGVSLVDNLKNLLR